MAQKHAFVPQSFERDARGVLYISLKPFLCLNRPQNIEVNRSKLVGKCHCDLKPADQRSPAGRCVAAPSRNFGLGCLARLGIEYSNHQSSHDTANCWSCVWDNRHCGLSWCVPTPVRLWSWGGWRGLYIERASGSIRFSTRMNADLFGI